MKKSLSLCLAASVVSLTGLFAAPSVAHADTSGCSQFVETPPQTIGVLDKTVHVPGIKARVCGTGYGDPDLTHAPSYVTPRIQPGVCDSSVFDPLCLTVFVDWGSPWGLAHEQVEIYIDGVAQPPIGVDIPRYPLSPGTTCVLSMGYKAAPTHPCTVFYDMGQ